MTASGAINGLAQRAIAGGATGAISGGATGAVAAGIAAAVREAAARTGVDFSYLMAQAQVESGLNPTAKAKTSSARGLYQFTNATWIETVRKHGAAHGLGWAADAIGNGSARAGSAARATILSMRDDAQAAALMAGEFAADNAALLEKKLGRAMGATDLYMAHFLGAGGATKFLGALQNSPGLAAAGLFPGAAAANRAVFFGRDGAARSVGEVYARFAGKLGVVATAEVAPARRAEMAASRAVAPTHGGQGLPVSVAGLPVSAAAFPVSAAALPVSAAAVPVEIGRARMAYMLLAELGA